MIVGWTALTLYVERPGPPKQWEFNNNHHTTKALIVFDADPFYNLDEQICLSFAKALSENGFNVRVATVAAAASINKTDHDLIVYCANTYNWRPDWAITDYIEEQSLPSENRNVVAITLGAGSTESAKKRLEEVIVNQGGKLLGSYALWLWRPNDEQKMEQPNVDVAVEMAYAWGHDAAQKMK